VGISLRRLDRCDKFAKCSCLPNRFHPAASTAAGVRRTYRLDGSERAWMARDGVAYVIGR